MRSFVKVWAFFRKEIVDVIRQPKLLVTLVLGPFLILALFGLGYQEKSDPLRAVLIVSEQNTDLKAVLEAKVDELDNRILLVDTSSEQADGMAMVAAGDADVVLIAPEHPYETVRNGERAIFTVLHNELDPFEQSTISLLSGAAIDTVNREILAEIIAAGQDESVELAPILTTTRETAADLRVAIAARDDAAASAAKLRLSSQIDELLTSVGPSDTVQSYLGDSLSDEEQSQSLTARINGIDERVETLGDGSPATQADEIALIETELAEIEGLIAEFKEINPDVLVRPLAVDTQLIGAEGLDVASFYAPGVIALLLQHLAITFAALSLVRERALGTTELYKVAPLGPGHILTGKYLGFAVTGAVVAAALTGLMLEIFGVPMAGSLVDLSVVMGLLILASLGVGFVISGLVGSDTQAVNVAMIFLLLSTFFSGFFLSLARLVPAVRAVSWSLPITHALDSMRDIMFRGVGIDTRTFIALGIGTIGLYLVAWLLLRRRLATR